MGELELYLASHPEIDKLAVFMGNCDMESLKHIFEYVVMEECIVICPWNREEINKWKEQIPCDFLRGKMNLPEKISFVSLVDFHGMTGQWALCLLSATERDVEALLRYRPAYICGSFLEEEGWAFSLWEQARRFVLEINLKVLKKRSAPLILDWRKGEYEKELSVIFPVYNVAAYLEKCLSTVTFWKADYVEFLFVSDGSTDDSVEIIKEWQKKDSRIILIEKKNGGCASARQCGLEKACGRYVGFIDPDDFVDINMYPKLLACAMVGCFDISLCGYNEYYENSGKIKPAEDILGEPYIYGCYDKDKIEELVAYSRVAIWRGIYRREFLERNKIHFYTDIRRFDDLPFKVETFAFARSVVIVPEYLYYYRLEREGQDVAADDDRLYVHFEIFKHLNNSILKSKNQKLIDNLQMCKIQTHRYALSKIRQEFREEYVKRAREDLNSSCSFQRTYRVANMMLGNEVADDYRKLMQE